MCWILNGMLAKLKRDIRLAHFGVGLGQSKIRWRMWKIECNAYRVEDRSMKVWMNSLGVMNDQIKVEKMKQLIFLTGYVCETRGRRTHVSVPNNEIKRKLIPAIFPYIIYTYSEFKTEVRPWKVWERLWIWWKIATFITF